MNNLAFIGHNYLEHLIGRISNAHARVVKGGQEWVEGSLELASALREARDRCPANISFSDWLKKNNLDFYSKQDRAALIGLGSELILAQKILTETDSRSYRQIWDKHKNRFPRSGNTSKSQSRRTHVPRARKINHRAIKLGEDNLQKLKGTSLDRAEELDELIILNRGAQSGELTEIVQNLIADAVAGKTVSAIAFGRQRKAPTLMECWKKRMAFAWAAASHPEREAFLDHLISVMKE